MDPQGCMACALVRGRLPMRWRAIDPIHLLKPGLYLRRQGSLQQIAKELTFRQAVAFALWEDPHVVYRVPNPEAGPPIHRRIGTHAAWLIPSPLSEGPPWIPLVTPIRDTPDEHERGLLSPWLDQAAALRFSGRLTPKDGRPELSCAAEPDESEGTEALAALMMWLAEHPDDPSASAEAARLLLLHNGHGLQRYGVSLLLADDATRESAVRKVLPALAPQVAPLFGALWSLWAADDADEAERKGHVVALARVLSKMLQPGAVAQQPANLALIACFLQGLFGLRPDREHRQPAVSLFLIGRSLEAIRHDASLLDHPDASLPSFPLTRTDMDALVRELLILPREETDLERLLRALATAEAGHALHRPSLDHLRCFAICVPRLHGWPVALRALLGRYDYIVSNWSFRGRELDRADLPLHRLQACLEVENPSLTNVRALARVSGGGRLPALNDLLAAADHPTVRSLATLSTLDDDALIAEATRASNAPITKRDAVFEALGALDMLIARAASSAGSLSSLTLPPPLPPQHEGNPVRAHFMYWRATCRAASPAQRHALLAWLDDVLPNAASLSPKLQAELLALLRQFAQEDALTGHAREAVLRFTGGISEAIGDAQGPRGERLELLLHVQGHLDTDAALATLTRAVHRPGDHLRELDRLLEVVERHRWARELVAHPLFADMHRLLSLRSDSGSRAARMAWIRLCLRGTKSYPAMRDLLDARRNPRLAQADALALWFERDGMAATKDAGRAVEALLDIAVAVQPDEELDTVIEIMRSVTQWPAREIVKLLQTHGRTEAAVGWILESGAATPEDIDQALLRLCQRARCGDDLYRVAGLLYRRRERFGAWGSDLERAVDDAFLAWVPEVRLQEGWLAGLHAARLVARGRLSPSLRDLATLAMGQDTLQGPAAAWLAWCLHLASADALSRAAQHIDRSTERDALRALLRASADAETLSYFQDLARTRKGGLRRLRALWSSHDLGRPDINALLSAWWDRALEDLPEGSLAGQAEESEASSDIEGTSAGDEPVGGDAQGDDGTDDTLPTEHARPDGSPLLAWLMDAWEESVEHGLRRRRMLEGLDSNAAQRLSAFCPRRLALRRDLLSPVAEQARQRGWKILDDKHILDGRRQAARHVDLDAEDVHMIIGSLMDLAERERWAKSLELHPEGWTLSMAPPRVRVGRVRESDASALEPSSDDQDTALTDDEAAQDPGHEDLGADASAAMAMEVAEGDESPAEADEGDAPRDADGTGRPEGASARDVLRLIAQGKEVSPVDSLRVFGESGRALAIATLLKRNRRLSLRLSGSSLALLLTGQAGATPGPRGGRGRGRSHR